MSKHTPGPWQTLPEEVDKPYIRIRGTMIGQRYKVANVLTPIYDGSDQWEADETRANARLIAAAPDLLIELQSAVIQLRAAGDAIEAGRYDEALLHARSMMGPKLKAIAKATGEQP